MAPGPSKQFDPTEALEKAMEIFWAKGYAATGMAEIQAAMGIGRKSLYDTFGSKRALFISALRHYSEAVVAQLRQELGRAGSPLGNVRRTMGRIARSSCEPGSRGCLLGVAMAQFRKDDPEMAGILRGHMKQIEDVFHEAFRRARQAGELRDGVNLRDLARLFMSTQQGMALIGRVSGRKDVAVSIVQAALTTLRAA